MLTALTLIQDDLLEHRASVKRDAVNLVTLSVLDIASFGSP